MLLRDKAGDVQETHQHISEATAKKIWDHLRKLDTDHGNYYYDSREGRVSIILFVELVILC
jgi:hypothetical protein